MGGRRTNAAAMAEIAIAVAVHPDDEIQRPRRARLILDTRLIRIDL